MNPIVLNSLPVAEKATGIVATLFTASGKEYPFLFNPERIRYSREAIYATSPTAASSTQRKDYQYTSNLKIDIPDLLLETSGEGKSVRPLLEGLNELLVADTVNNSLEPPLIGFRWGTESIYPAVLESISYETVAWLGGEPASGRLSITLTQVPLPDNQPSQSQPPSADELNTVALTDRQRQDARTAAATWLNSNINSLRPRVREKVRSRAFRYLTNTNGEVRITDSEGNDLGLVGTYNGTTLDTSRNNVTTQ